MVGVSLELGSDCLAHMHIAPLRNVSAMLLCVKQV